MDTRADYLYRTAEVIRRRKQQKANLEGTEQTQVNLTELMSKLKRRTFFFHKICDYWHR
jgi:hypothetical protein